MDDTFVVLSAWWRTRVQDSVPRRMADAYEEAAVSITITSLTDMFSFWVGVATPIPSVQIFCLYSGTSVWPPALQYLQILGLYEGCKCGPSPSPAYTDLAALRKALISIVTSSLISSARICL